MYFTLFFVGLLASAALGQQKTIKPYEFTPGKTYTYEYSARLLTGIPKIAEQYSAFQMQADVIIQARSTSEVSLKIKDVKSIQKDQQQGADLKEEDIEKLQKWTEEYARELEKPIMFNHKNGKVSSFSADRDEPEWSINIKKSILSLLNLNLTPKEVLRAPQGNLIPKPVSQGDLTYYGVYEQGMGGVCETTYEINQMPSAEQQNQPLAERQEQTYALNVTKTRNFNNCLTRTTTLKDNFSLRHGEQQHQHQPTVKGYYPVPEAHEQIYQGRFDYHEDEAVQQYNHVRYNISMTGSRATIEGIRSEGRVVYSAFGAHIMTITQQNMTLTKVGRSPNVHSIQNAKKHKELTFRLPKMSMSQGGSSQAAQNQLDIPHMAIYGRPNTEELKQKLPRIFDALARQILSNEADSESKDAMQKVVQIVNSLSTLQKQDLEKLFRETAEKGRDKNASPKEQLTRKMYLDALALCGTNDAALYIRDLIIENRVSTFEAVQLLEALPQNMYLPDVKTVDAFLELAQHPRVANRPQAHTAASICFAKLVNNGYNKAKAAPGDLPNKNRKSLAEQEQDQFEAEEEQNKKLEQQRWDDLFAQKPLTKEDVERYVVVASRNLEEANTFTKKVTAIETLAHMAVPEVLLSLEPYVSGSASLNSLPGYSIEEGQNLMKERTFVRTVAIYALAHVAQKYPQQVLPIVLPVYRDNNEPQQTRLAAFTILMLSQPKAHVLESIASDLHQEQDKHIVNYVVSALKSIGNNTAPCMKRVAKAAAEAAAAAPEPKRSSRYSKFSSKNYYDEKKNFGLWATTEIVQSKRSPLPKAAYLSLLQSTGPFHEQLLEIGFEGKGLEKIVRRIVGRNGLIESILENRENTPRSHSQLKNKITTEEAVQQLRKRLSSTLKYESGSESAKINLFVKLFERTSLYPMDENTMLELIDSAEKTIESWTKQLTHGYSGTFCKIFMPSSLYNVVPSELGLPVVVSHKHPIILSLKVNQAKINKKIQSGEVRGFEAVANIEPKIFYSSYTFMFGVVPVQRTAVGTHVEKTTQASLPINIRVSYNRQQQKWSIEAEPKVNHDIIYHKTEAKTFVSRVQLANSPNRDWLETAQSIRSKNFNPMKMEKRLAHPDIPIAAKIAVEAEDQIRDRKTIEEKIQKKGLIPTAVEIFRNPKLCAREVHIKFESREGQEPKIAFEWSTEKNQGDNEERRQGEYQDNNNNQWGQEGGNSQEDYSEESYRRQQQNKHQHGKHSHDGGNSSEEKNDFYENDYERDSDRDSEPNGFMNKMFNRVSSALQGQNLNDKDIKKMQKKANQWLHQTRRSMSWAIDSNQDDDSQDDDESREQQQQQQSYRTMSRNQYQKQNNECQRMKTEFVIRDGNKVCFTTRPVLSCGNACQPRDMKEIEVDFHCLPRASPFTQNLMNEADNFKVVKQLVNKRVDFRQTLSVPTECVA